MQIQRISIRVADTLFFPLQKVFFWGFNSAVTQPLIIITGHHQLHGGKEITNKSFFLIV